LPAANKNFSFISKGRKESVNVFPNGSNFGSSITKVEILIPSIALSKPINPWSRGGAVKFEQELLKKACIPFTQVWNAKSTFIFWKADFIPSNFTLTSFALILSSPKERTMFFN